MKLFLSNVVLGRREVHVVDFVKDKKRATCQLLHVDKINEGEQNKGFYLTDANGEHFSMCSFSAVATEDGMLPVLPKDVVIEYLKGKEELSIQVAGTAMNATFKLTEVK